ncbi:MAG: M23 family metallopeptidase [Clostridia bacterium]|nr:M23 family metallopeptidase [Clostridia bacterium]
MGMRGKAGRFGAGVRAHWCRLKKAMMDYAYLMTLLAAVTVIAASAAYTKALEERTAAQAAAAAHEIGETPSPAPLPVPTQAVLRPQTTLAPVRMGGGRAAPVSGGVLRGYDTAHVYWAALSCYKPHAALDLAAQAGETVLCAMDGVVERASRDDLWGWRVTVAQTDGRRAVYAGLLLCRVQAGQCVTRGQALGEIMDAIPCEAELGTHLHLELDHDGVPQDPAQLLPEGR